MAKVNIVKALKVALVISVVGLVLLWALSGILLAPLLGVSAAIFTAWLSIAGFIGLFISAAVGYGLGEWAGWF